jgi:F-type H+-transporting ATPase subunit delta
MSAELIAKKYAKVLIEIENQNELKSSLQVLEMISKTLAEPKVAEIISSPLISNSKKFEIFLKPLEGKISKNLFSILKIMSQKGRLPIIPILKDILSSELRKQSNSFEGEVKADKELNKTELKKLQDILSKYSGSKIVLKQIDKKSDGLKVRVDELGLELNYSKYRVKNELLEYIQKAL